MEKQNPPPGATGDGRVSREQDLLQVLDNPPAILAQQFDYSVVGSNVAADLQQRACRIRHCMRASIIGVGRELLEAKRHHLEHGQFIAWVEAECGLNKRTAQRMMQAAEWAEGKSDTVSFLPPTVIYALSAPSTPPEIHDAIVARIDAGERLDPDEVKAKIEAAKREAAKTAKHSRLTPEQRAARERKEARRLRELEKQRRDIAERDERRDAGFNALVDFLVKHIADLDRLYDLLVEADLSLMLRQRIAGQRAAVGPAQLSHWEDLIIFKISEAYDELDEDNRRAFIFSIRGALDALERPE